MAADVVTVQPHRTVAGGVDQEPPGDSFSAVPRRQFELDAIPRQHRILVVLRLNAIALALNSGGRIKLDLLPIRRGEARLCPTCADAAEIGGDLPVERLGD